MLNSFWRGEDIIGDLVIMSGYIFTAIKIAPYFKLKYWWTRVGAVFFFGLCGCTHLRMAYQHFRGFHHATVLDLFITNPQAIAVWMFVIGIYYEFILHPTSPSQIKE